MASLDKSTNYNIKNVENALDVFNAFLEKGARLSAVQIQEYLDTNTNMAFRLLTTMVNAGYLRYDEETAKYYPSLRVLQLCNTVLNNLEIRRLAMGSMHSFYKDHPEFNCNLAVLEGDALFSVHRFNSTANQQYFFNPGMRLPPHASATGKVLLAAMTDEEALGVVERNGMKVFTENTITDPKLLLKQLAQVRLDGVGWSHSEHIPHLHAAAAPVRGADGKAVAAISISFFSPSGDTALLEGCLPKLKAMAYDVSYASGWH